jgi:hypothetical protein
MGEKNENFALRSILLTLASGFLHAVKSYDMGPLASPITVAARVKA